VSYLGSYVSSDGEEYIVMEFLAHGSLDNYIRKHKNEIKDIDLLSMYVLFVLMH
jgi:serine/threonine protein kinase